MFSRVKDPSEGWNRYTYKECFASVPRGPCASLLKSLEETPIKSSQTKKEKCQSIRLASSRMSPLFVSCCCDCEQTYLYEVTKNNWSEADEAASSSHFEEVVTVELMLSKRCMTLMLIVFWLEVCVMIQSKRESDRERWRGFRPVLTFLCQKPKKNVKGLPFSQKRQSERTPPSTALGLPVRVRNPVFTCSVKCKEVVERVCFH